MHLSLEKLKYYVLRGEQTRAFLERMQKNDAELIEEVYNEQLTIVQLFEGDFECGIKALRFLLQYYEADIQEHERRMKMAKPKAIVTFLGERLETYRSDVKKVRHTYEKLLRHNTWYFLPETIVYYFISAGERVIKIPAGNYWGCHSFASEIIEYIFNLHIKDNPGIEIGATPH